MPMNKEEEITLKMRLVDERLQQISVLTGQMAMVGTAQSGNERFDALMRDFDRMLDISNDLIRQWDALKAG